MIPHGRFCWYELMTGDLDAAQAFYGEVLGWSVAPSDMPHMDYRLIGIGNERVAGIMALMPGGPPPGWVSYVAVDVADGAVAEAEAAGGTVLRAPMTVPGVGRFGFLADPGGAMLAVIALDPAYAAAPVRLDTPGHVGWNELVSRDWPAALAFYARLFSWTKGEAVDVGPMGTYQLFGTPERNFGGMMNAPEGAAPGWIPYFNVNDTAVAADRVTAGGGSLIGSIRQVQGGAKVVHCRDPQGARFALSSVHEEHA